MCQRCDVTAREGVEFIHQANTSVAVGVSVFLVWFEIHLRFVLHPINYCHAKATLKVTQQFRFLLIGSLFFILVGGWGSTPSRSYVERAAAIRVVVVVVCGW